MIYLNTLSNMQVKHVHKTKLFHVCSHICAYVEPLQNKRGLKCHTVRSTAAADSSCPVNDHNTVVLLLCGSLAFFL